ncbi:MAG: BatD family protein [Chloroflexi bacterium]|nr:BatD family protein [Chloroflexota bacterium]
MNKKIVFILLAIMFACVQAAQASVWLTSSVDKNKITVGEKINYTLILEYDPKSGIVPPNPDEFKFDPFTVRDYVAAPMPDKEGRKVLQYVFQITVYQLGKFETPQIVVAYKEKDGKEAYARSRKIPVEVVPVPQKKGDKPGMLRPPKPVEIVNFPAWYYLVLALIILVLAAVVWFIISHIKRRKKEEAERVPPPDETALSALSELEKEDLPSRERWKDYYSELSNILRQYLGARFGLPAPESTTWELIRMMKKKSMEPQVIEDTGQVLSLADLVKFAKHVPAAADCTGDMSRARKIIETTGPEPENAGNKKGGEAK